MTRQSLTLIFPEFIKSNYPSLVFKTFHVCILKVLWREPKAESLLSRIFPFQGEKYDGTSLKEGKSKHVSRELVGLEFRMIQRYL